MKYIAYGSNMSREQMKYRTPQAKLLGTGYIQEARLEFYVHATVEYTGDANDRVPVAVWEIDDRDEQRLDLYEGFPNYYIKKQWIVHMEDGSEIQGMIYLMKTIYKQPPERAYYEGILNAYFDFGLHEQAQSILVPALQRSYARSNCRKRF